MNSGARNSVSFSATTISSTSAPLTSQWSNTTDFLVDCLMCLKIFHQQCMYSTKSFFGLPCCAFTLHHNVSIDILFCFLHLYMTSVEYNILSVSSTVRQRSGFNSQRNKIIFFILWKLKKYCYTSLTTLSWWTESVTVPPTGNSEYSFSLQCLLHLFVQELHMYGSSSDSDNILCPYIWISECFDGLFHTVGNPLPAYKATLVAWRERMLCQT